MIDGLVAGTLVDDPQERRGKSDSIYVLLKLRALNAEGEPIVVNVIAFDAELGAILMELRDGDAVALTGSLTPKVWSDKQGNARAALDMVASRLLRGPELPR